MVARHVGGFSGSTRCFTALIRCSPEIPPVQPPAEPDTGIANQLIALANQAGGPDNITVVVGFCATA